jgi:hypothetical protein
MNPNFKQFPIGNTNPQIMVISHERSGTHFLMNSISNCFGYISRPWFDFDNHQLNINYYSPNVVQSFFKIIANKRISTIIKSHHHSDFFSTIHKDFKIFYIHRHPVYALRSYWKHIQSFEWVGGPKNISYNDFLRAAPMGNMMRYQIQQEESIVHRWKSHIEGWVNMSELYPNNVHLVSYESLKDDYNTTITNIGKKLNIEPLNFNKPNKNNNVITPTAKIDYDSECILTPDDKDYIYNIAGDVMDKLGYTIN